MASISAQDSRNEAQTHLHQLRTMQGKLESTKEELSKVTKGTTCSVPTRSPRDET